jgi:peptidoglycan LD-endopeptidase LytH
MKTRRLVIAVCITLGVAVLAVALYHSRDTIQTTFSDIAYAIKLPFNIIKLASSPPDKVLVMPVRGIQVKNVADTWGDPRSEGRMHEGQDIFAPKGREVYSATGGYIMSIGQNRLGGNVIFVLGAGGRRYYYAHLNSFAPDIGRFTKVDPYTLIGYVGNTGNAETTPPHLHFSVYTKEGPIDPLPLLQDRKL